MFETLLIYGRNSLRLLGFGVFLLGVCLLLYSWVLLLQTGIWPVWDLQDLVPVPRWLRAAPPLVQGLCGWPVVVLREVPLPLLCLVGGLLAQKV